MGRGVVWRIVYWKESCDHTNAFYWPNFILVLGSTTCAITQEHYPTISCIFKSQVFTYSQVCVLLLQSLHLHPNLQQKMYSTLLTMRNLLLFSTLLSFLHVWRSTWVNVSSYLSYVKVEYPWYARLALLCTILPTVIQILRQIMHSTRQVLQTVNSDNSPLRVLAVTHLLLTWHNCCNVQYMVKPLNISFCQTMSDETT